MGKPADKIHKFLNVTCESSNQKIAAIEVCELTQNTTLNLSFDFLQPFEEFFVSFFYWESKSFDHSSLLKLTIDTGVKEKHGYRRIYITPTMDYCALAKGVRMSQLTALLRSVIEQVKIDGRLFHECPYKGKIVIKGLDVKDESFFLVYPTGTYRSVVVMSNNKDNVTLTFVTAITTPNKFGWNVCSVSIKNVRVHRLQSQIPKIYLSWKWITNVKS